MRWIVGGVIILAALGAAGGLYIWIVSALFDGHVDELRAEMIARQGDVTGQLTDLPEIVRAYAAKAGGQVGGAPVVHLRHEATLQTAATAPPIAITADQWTGTIYPGIVWRARGVMNGLPVSVVDAYVAGRGELSARLLGAFQVAGGQGADYDKGELMRYMSELPVHPDAILNNAALTWRQLDPRTVEVSAQSATGSAVLRFIFDESGDIVRMEADDRPMSVDGGTVPTPWHGLYSQYRKFGRYRIPAYGEVGWVVADGLLTYWRGTVVAYEPLR